MKTFFQVAIELFVLGIVVCATFAWTGHSPRSGRRMELAVARLARRRVLCCILVGLTTLALRAVMLPVWHIPRPIIHDEFSYLLGADTFASGRLANPTPTLWPFFESIHILVTPRYVTKFPPAQSMALAIGQVLLGHPWFGVWLSCGVMVGAICWMLQGWLPSRWAFLGGCCAIVPLGVGSYWMNSYWGGAVAATGGCLVMGAYPRITRQRRSGPAWVMGLGLMILANSRPLEGAILALPVIVALIFHLAKEPIGRAWRIAMPLAVCLVMTAGFMGYYNFRTTGIAFRSPYLEHYRQYQMVPLLMFLPGNAPKNYRHEDQRAQYAGWEVGELRRERTHFVATRASELWKADVAFLRVALTAPLLLLPLVLRDRRIRLLLLFLGIPFAMAAISNGFKSHYLAPATGCVFALLVQCLRHLRVSRFLGRPAGAMLTMALPLAAAIAFAVTQGIELRWQRPLAPLSNPSQRPEVEQQLLRSGPKQLVFVRYQLDGSDSFADWVYNPADIDSAPVVWAQDMGPEENQLLRNYYPERKAWLFEPNLSPPRMIPYPP